MSTSDGSTADYYELPAGATELQDLISHRDMNAQIGEVFRACYRYGIVSHSGKLRDAKKIRFYADAEVKRLEKLLAQAKVDGCCATESQQPAGGFTYHFDPMTPPPSFGQQNMIDPADVDIAREIDDDSQRQKIIGQSCEMASEVYAAVDAMTKWQGVPEWSDAPEWAEWLAMDSNGEWYWYERQIRASKLRGVWEYGSGMSGAIQSAAYSSDDDRPDWRSSLQPRPVK